MGCEHVQGAQVTEQAWGNVMRTCGLRKTGQALLDGSFERSANCMSRRKLEALTELQGCDPGSRLTQKCNLPGGCSSEVCPKLGMQFPTQAGSLTRVPHPAATYSLRVGCS